VRLLFDHGARICGDGMEEAAEHGWWDVVRILAAHGADPGKAICGAVKYESEDIVREMVGKGMSLEGGVGTVALAAAKKEGLQSMIALLEELMNPQVVAVP